MMLTLFFFKPILTVGSLIEDIIGDLLGKYKTLSNCLGFPCSSSESLFYLADIFIILLFNVDLALYCRLGRLKRRNVLQRPYNAKKERSIWDKNVEFWLNALRSM